MEDKKFWITEPSLCKDCRFGRNKNGVIHCSRKLCDNWQGDNVDRKLTFLEFRQEKNGYVTILLEDKN